jgi:hypothetical protein
MLKAGFHIKTVSEYLPENLRQNQGVNHVDLVTKSYKLRLLLNLNHNSIAAMAKTINNCTNDRECS